MWRKPRIRPSSGYGIGARIALHGSYAEPGGWWSGLCQRQASCHSSQIYKDMASLDRQYKTKSGENDKKQLQKKTLEGIILTENLQEETIMMKSELVLEREYEYYDV